MINSIKNSSRFSLFYHELHYLYESYRLLEYFYFLSLFKFYSIPVQFNLSCYPILTSLLPELFDNTNLFFVKVEKYQFLPSAQITNPTITQALPSNTRSE